MSWCNRRTLMLAPLALAACGFTPVYGPGGAGSALDGRVLVDSPETEDGYLIRRDLEHRLGRAADEGFRLTVMPRTSVQGQAVTAAGEITRYSLVGEAAYTLTDAASGQVVTAGKVENFTGYSATGSTVETLASETDARKRLMTILADQIVVRLLALDGLA